MHILKTRHFLILSNCWSILGLVKDATVLQGPIFRLLRVKTQTRQIEFAHSSLTQDMKRNIS